MKKFSKIKIEKILMKINMENKNPYHPLIEIIDAILRKIENRPPNTDTISLRPSEIFSFKDKNAGYEEMYSFLENLKNKGVIKDFQCVDSLYRIFYLKISDIDREKLIKERGYWEERSKKTQKATLSPLSFDKKACIVKCGEKQFSLQRKRGRCGILKELWEHRRIINYRGDIKREGAFTPIEVLAEIAGFAKDATDFENKKKTIERKVRDAIQDLRSQFKRINAPVEIIAKNGYMLVIKE
jgi:hypothetical protein